MLKDEIMEKLVEILDESRVSVDVPMAEWTSFKTGGIAECMVHPKSDEEIKERVSLAKS